jgi:predicted nucleic acid-binding protein
MSAFLLDTNVPSEVARSQPDTRVHSWFLTQPAAILHLSAITIGELRRGVSALPDGRRRAILESWIDEDLLPSFAGRILPVTSEVADKWGRLSAARRLSGRPLGMADGLIAATAFEHGLTLVTRNERDYLDLGVEILNPWKSMA